MTLERIGKCLTFYFYMTLESFKFSSTCTDNDYNTEYLNTNTAAYPPFDMGSLNDFREGSREFKNDDGNEANKSEQDSYTVTQIPQQSSIVNGISFYFTEQPHSTCSGWNTNNGSMKIDESGESDEDTFLDVQVEKSYEAFEDKLREGFLEAPNLGLVCVPPAMFDYNPPIQRVDLKDNKIETLPDHFFDELPLLTWCDLRYNRLISLPQMNKRHDCLNVLLLQDNDLCELPYSLAYASNLHTLGWTNNQIIDPPRHVLIRGCKQTMDYLRTKLIECIPVDSQGNLTSLETDAQLREELSKTMKKSVPPKKSASRTSICSETSEKSAAHLKKMEEMELKKRVDRIKYTWGLWKDIPYHGPSEPSLLRNSLQEVKDDVRKRINQDKDKILQKVKDHEVLRKFRWDTRMLQTHGPQKEYDGVSAPFGTDVDVPPKVKSDGDRLDPEMFRKTITSCLSKLQEFATNPTPINDTEKSLQRLREVEDIQRKLLDMKVEWSVKSSDPAV